MDDQPTGIVEVLEDIKKKSPNFYKVLFSLPSYNSLDGHGQRKRVYRLHQQVIFPPDSFLFSSTDIPEDSQVLDAESAFTLEGLKTQLNRLFHIPRETLDRLSPIEIQGLYLRFLSMIPRLLLML